MSRFRGKYEYSVDAKGRFNVPAPFRKLLHPDADDTFVIVRGPDRCLRAYPQNNWEKEEDKLDELPETPKNRLYKRRVLATLGQSQLDKQGRIAMTADQKESVGIDKSLTIFGNKGFIEVWGSEVYEDYCRQAESQSFDELFNNAVEQSKQED